MKPLAPVPSPIASPDSRKTRRPTAGDKLPVSLQRLSPRHREAVVRLYHHHRQQLAAQGELECACVASIALALYRHDQVTAIKTGLQGHPQGRELPKFLKALEELQKNYRHLAKRAENILRTVQTLRDTQRAPSLARTRTRTRKEEPRK